MGECLIEKTQECRRLRATVASLAVTNDAWKTTFCVLILFCLRGSVGMGVVVACAVLIIKHPQGLEAWQANKTD